MIPLPLPLSCALLMAACSGTNRTQQHGAGAPASQDAEVLMQQRPVRLIDRPTLQAVVHSGGAVGVVRVIKAEILRAGTRSETASIDAEVLERVYGELSDTVNIRRYTSRGDVVLT